MNWRQRILADFPTDMQRLHRAKMALGQIDEALAVLASLGHPLHIEAGPALVVEDDWPRVVFHIRAGQREVRCQADLDELGPDWYPTMEEARQAAGMTKQMQRGGIFDRALPTVPTRTSDDFRRELDEAEARRQAVHNQATEARQRNREAAIAMPGIEGT